MTARTVPMRQTAESGPQRLPVPALVHRRRMIAAVLTALTIALGVVLVVVLGPEVLAAYLPGLPLALILLWVGTDALRFDEREETAVHDRR